ncbi:transport system permease protein [Methanolacinia petrolearia DSM 11571]|uniref:Cobalamin import system permease protein BtuC n=1 Tax=Methanolacinia petrolearia (strain DSM 11571 / OCM 486 / SEBR 4847) TaxID=679926 RepID=E1RGX2_METP4|nr:iron ABC transporter permease [Methanolacinia petrolearia]ADN37501.1 transport system permease protein [Methanolacinia petrolearia DSM 11571]
MNEERTLDHCGAVTGKVHETINQLITGLRKRETLVRYLIYLSVPVFLVISLFIGRYQMDPFQTIQVLVLGVSDQVLSFIHNAGHAVLPSLFTGEFTPQSYELKGETVLFNIRLPRILGAALVGAALAVAGAAFQGLFKNPLVSPDILGVSSGAGFGAALAILLIGNALAIQASAFAFGIVAVASTCLIGKIYKGSGTLVLVLAGIITGAFFSALLSLVKYMADPYDTLPAIIFWLMGSLGSVSMDDLVLVSPAIIAGIVVIYLLRWRINVMSLGEEEALALGVDTKKTMRIIIICATLMTASAVCISGVVGWIGLVIPHLGRMLTGPDFKTLVPVSAFLGATYLILIDDLARTVATVEIPLGVLTALIGAPFFAYLLSKKSVGWV